MSPVYRLHIAGLILCTQIFTINADRPTFIKGHQFYDPHQVKEYNDYGSITLFPFLVPERVGLATWQIMKHRSDEKCPPLSVNVALQNGSFPIINPRNESFPDHTYRGNPDLQTYEIPADDEHLLRLMVSNPNPGYWFLAAYLPQDDDDRIKQEGLSRECYYFVQPIMSYDQMESIQSLNDKAITPYSIQENVEYALFRYFAEANLEAIQITISGCKSNNSVSDLCPISLSFEAESFPFPSEPEVVCNSSKSQQCSFTVQDPWQDSWYYLRVNKTIPNLAVDFSIHVDITACSQSPYDVYYDLSDETNDTVWYHSGNGSRAPSYAFQVYEQKLPAADGDNEESATNVGAPPFITESNLYVITPPLGEEEGNLSGVAQTLANCPKMVTLSTFEGKSTPFKEFIRGDANDTADTYAVPVDRGRIIAKFFLDPVLDIGGTLQIKANFVDKNITLKHNITVTFCLKHGAPPHAMNGTSCTSEFGFTLFEDNTVEWNIPFPTGGWWFMSMEAKCISNPDDEPCPSSVISQLKLQMMECINLCGPNGKCHIYHQNGFQLYGCACVNGYGGWGCTDDSNAWSRSYYLTVVLLLTLSNLFFIFPVILATYRHFFAEAVVYFCTLIFSTFYHACDSSKWCIMDYNTLQFCDFFASFMALFITLIAMAKVPSSVKQTLHMLGTFGLALATTYNRFSLWAAAVPITCGIIVVLISWGYRWNKRRRCYPSGKRWLLCIVPGVLIATTGLITFSFLETEQNYQYVHSAWHVCMAIGVLLLLPPRIKQDVIHDMHMSELIDVNELNSELVENEILEY